MNRKKKLPTHFPTSQFISQSHAAIWTRVFLVICCNKHLVLYKCVNRYRVFWTLPLFHRYLYRISAVEFFGKLRWGCGWSLCSRRSSSSTCWWLLLWTPPRRPTRRAALVLVCGLAAHQLSHGYSTAAK